MTTTFTPTLYQHLATDYQRNMAITAGAGTGKTAVLTRRIIKILGREKHYLDRLMVLTFTDKAAVEMKERIYQAIEKELAQTGEDHFQKLKDTFLHNYISTFHSFCAALLREYPIEAGIDPYFRVLDETEKVFFLRRSINKSLRELAAKKDEPNIQVLSDEFSRSVLAECVYKIIQKREDSGYWLQQMNKRTWPDYREQLEQYRRIILREIIYKFHASGILKNHLKVLEDMGADLPGTEYSVDRKREEAMRLLEDFDEKISLIAEREIEERGNDLENSPAIDVQELTELKRTLIQVLKISGSAPKAWPEHAYKELKDCFTSLRYRLEAFPLEEFEIAEEHEKNGFAILKALAYVTRYCLQAYHDQKNEENYLDFQDLQLRTEKLLDEEKNKPIVNELRERFQYIMVDEFQDTNDLQWKIIKKIAADSSGQIVNPRVFVVGDEKQAIYSFRGGDVRLFSRVREELKEANRKSGCQKNLFDLQLNQAQDYTFQYNSEINDDRILRSGEIIFADNFRSAMVPIQFFNLFFRDLLSRDVYEEHDARPQLLRCSGNDAPGSVEFFLVDNSKKKQDDAMNYVPGEDRESGNDTGQSEQLDLKPHFKEALLIADKIKEVFLGDEEKYARVREEAARGHPAIAILLNRRTMIKSYEEALRLCRINFSVVRGRGFYQRQEIIDLGNLLTFFTDRDDDLALAAFLRSPAGHLSDEGLFLLSEAPSGSTLWEKLQNCAGELAGTSTGLKQAEQTDHFYDGEKINNWDADQIFSGRDKQAILDAASSLSRWLNLSKRMPLVDFLRLVLKDGGYYVSLSRGSRGDQALSNLEKLMDNARELSLQDGADLDYFTEWLNDRINYIEEEGEADIDISLGGAVQIMTVHQSKGLEFPMVFVPDLAANFNLGERETIYAEAVPREMTVNGETINLRETPETGLDAPDPENEWEAEPILIKRIIKKRLRDKLIAEKKRLLYVACTRAMDHLILVGHANFNSEHFFRRTTYLPLDLLNNWMEWLTKITGLSSQIEGTRGMVRYVNCLGEDMLIPYCKFEDEKDLIAPETLTRTEFPINRE